MKKLTTVITTLITLGLQAQPSCPNDPNNPVPLDSGISILIAAGACFGAYKIYQAKQQHKAQSVQ